jgi:hypothetical protein
MEDKRSIGPREERLKDLLNRPGNIQPILSAQAGPPTKCPKCGSELFEKLEFFRVRTVSTGVIGENQVVFEPIFKIRCEKCKELLKSDEVQKQYAASKDGNSPPPPEVKDE